MSAHVIQARELVRTTVDLPASLLKDAEQAVKRGAARSRNALISQALEAYLRELEERRIDAEFALMADDPRYQAEMLQIAEEFAQADWEALQTAEGGLVPDEVPTQGREGGQP